jgi:hypothetical protein
MTLISRRKRANVTAKRIPRGVWFGGVNAD